MKRFITALLAAALTGALFVASPLVAAPKGTEEFNNNTTVTGTCTDSADKITAQAPAKLWPPNHKYYEDITVTVFEDNGTETTLTTIGTHDQYEGDTEMNGAGNTIDDIVSDDAQASVNRTNNEDSQNPQVTAIEKGTGGVTTDWDARSERSGQDQTGRTYTLSGDSTSGDGSCSIDILMLVPHDMRPSNR